MKKQITKITAFLLAMALCFTLFPADVQAASKVKLNKSKITIYTGGTTALKVTGTNRKASFKSSKPSVATVTSRGKITAKKAGAATITVKVGSQKLACKVTVKKEKAKLSKSKTSIYVGSSTTLKVTGTSRKVSYSSSKKSVATVTSSGKITGKKAGTATITAKVGTKKLACKVTVKKKAPAKPAVKLNKTSDTVLISYSRRLRVSGNSGKISWKSSKPSVATVDSKGIVTGKKAGTATITARVGGKNLTCKVTVPKYRLHIIDDMGPRFILVKKDVREVIMGTDSLLGQYSICNLGLSGTKTSDSVTWELVGSKKGQSIWGGFADRNTKLGIDGHWIRDTKGYKQYGINSINDNDRNFKKGSTELRVKINGKTIFKVKIYSVVSK